MATRRLVGWLSSIEAAFELCLKAKDWFTLEAAGCAQSALIRGEYLGEINIHKRLSNTSCKICCSEGRVVSRAPLAGRVWLKRIEELIHSFINRRTPCNSLWSLQYYYVTFSGAIHGKDVLPQQRVSLAIP